MFFLGDTIVRMTTLAEADNVTSLSEGVVGCVRFI